MGFFRKKNKSKEAAATTGAALPSELGAAITSGAATLSPPPKKPEYARGYVELGTIDYVNLTSDGRHGDFDAAIAAAKATGKPIFANFVEWIVDPEGKIVVGGTRQITNGSSRSLAEVKQAMRDALEDLGIDVPDYLA